MYMYSNKAETDNEHIYNDFKLKEPFALYGLYTNIPALYWISGMYCSQFFAVCGKIQLRREFVD